jgi:biotin synthase-related radical SAM superfamily protein
VDVDVFGRALTELTYDDVRSIAVDLRAVCTSTADEIAHTRSMLMIEQALRRAHRLHDAATVALACATNVQAVAQRAGVELPNDDVTLVARAAAQLARGLLIRHVPGISDALHELGRGWHRLPCVAELQLA